MGGGVLGVKSYIACSRDHNHNTDTPVLSYRRGRKEIQHFGMSAPIHHCQQSEFHLLFFVSALPTDTCMGLHRQAWLCMFSQRCRTSMYTFILQFQTDRLEMILRLH